jgi:hypothetical protein
MTTPRLILQAEGAALFSAAAVAYAVQAANWWLFATLFLVPDVFMLGYLHNTRTGAAIYNLGHSTLIPLATFAAGWILSTEIVQAIGLVWLAHVGLDRMLGYGLKYPDAFKHTHLSE